jgi:hypothetical protein
MEVLAWVSVPHNLREAGILADDFVLLRSPCRYGNYVGRCCLMMHLIKQGPLCFVCRRDRAEWIKVDRARSECGVPTNHTNSSASGVALEFSHTNAECRMLGAVAC